MRQPPRLRAAIALAALAAIPLIAAGGTTEPVDDTTATDTAPPTTDTAGTVAGLEEVDPERCATNRDAGTITYLTGFDYAAAASMVDVFVAEQAGYYDALCLDVDVVASFSTANYPLIAAGDAQFASGGSFSEVVDFAAANDADLVAVVVEGRFPIDALIVKPGEAQTLEDLAGTTIGVKGAITRSVEAMLAGVGLVEGEDYDTVLIDGFDPIAHIALDGIVGFPGYKSNEPGTLERAGIDFDLFDPIDHDVPGSFGVIYTSRDFLAEYPTAAQDFVRATMRGLADALDDPEAAAQAAFDLAEAGGNPNFLSLEGETFRWDTEAALLRESHGEAEGAGVPDVELLQAELDAYDAVGLFPEPPPAAERMVDVETIAGVYDDGEVIWPG
jgi:ABC-type nitrate/sulfonate/bicarbonate transport system substrate-binding protein